MSLIKLENKLSAEQIKHVRQWLRGSNVVIKLRGSRSSKLGDFKVNGDSFQISVNFDLVPELFFFTLTHEIAHLLCYKKFKRKVKPHGKEWKSIFAELIENSLKTYSIEFQEILKIFKKNPKASYYSFSPMVVYFDKTSGKETTYLQDIPLNSTFRIKGKLFIKKRKRKVRYLCTESSTGKSYLIHALANVEKV